jgi:hypothetical protein
MQESLRIPFVVMSPNTMPGVSNREYGQEDIAPTLLSVLDLPDNLQYADGSSINIKNYASIFVKANTEYQVSLWDAGRKVSESRDSELVFAGLPLNTNYTLKASGDDGTHEELLFLDSDKHFNFKPEQGLNYRGVATVILIFVVIIAGLVLIKRIKD